MSTLEAPTYVPQTATDGGRRPRRILLGMMVAVFFSGGVIGSGSTLMVVNRRIKENESPRDPVKWSERIVSELEEKLSLSEKQTEQVKQVMKEHLAALNRLRRETFAPRIREQFEQMKDQVDSVLDDEQRSQWHAWLDERQNRVCPSGGRAHNGHNRPAMEAGEGAAAAQPKSLPEKNTAKPDSEQPTQ
jgi:hypothetical protein